MTPADLSTLVLAFPETETGTSYGMPSFKAAGKSSPASGPRTTAWSSMSTAWTTATC